MTVERQIIGLVQIDTRNRIYVPSEVMEKFNLRKGDKLAFVEVGSRVEVEPSYKRRYREA